MHFEILVEDRSGSIAMNILLPRILGVKDTYRIHPYRGIGKIPKGLKTTADPQKRILLDQLPRLLQGYGTTFAATDAPAMVVVVCDLDRRGLEEFREELLGMLSRCNPQPPAQFFFAIEEGEAWFLGDIAAIVKAFPKAKLAVLSAYRNDEICGTWQKLADAVYPGGSPKLLKLEFHWIGKEKCAWAEKIPPHMDVEINRSPSFCYFRDNLRKLSAPST